MVLGSDAASKSLRKRRLDSAGIGDIFHPAPAKSRGEEGHPTYEYIPLTGFSCKGKMPGGGRIQFEISLRHSRNFVIKIAAIYADVETRCQSFHVCGVSDCGDMVVAGSFLCPVGSVFNEDKRTCDEWSADVRCTGRGGGVVRYL